MGLSLLSLVLMFADSRLDYLSRLRYYASMAVTPLHYVAGLPRRAVDDMLGTVRSRDDLAAENARLQDQLMMQQYQLQKLDYLTAENERLNDLLKASSIVDEEVVRVQLIGVSPDPFAKRILINKGSTENVYVGQPVLDPYGLMGQVVEVQPLTSWVLLISDPQHGTPVMINRNGTRAIAYGTRDSLHQLTLSDLPNTADIEIGDQLFTSGLGQKFPPGYLVGVVKSINHDPGKPFADVIATPTAQIDRSRNLLLVFENRTQVRVPQTPAVLPAEASPAVDLAPTGDTTAVETAQPVDGTAVEVPADGTAALAAQPPATQPAPPALPPEEAQLERDLAEPEAEVPAGQAAAQPDDAATADSDARTGAVN